MACDGFSVFSRAWTVTLSPVNISSTGKFNKDAYEKNIYI